MIEKDIDNALYQIDTRISLLEDINDVWIRYKGEFHMGIYILIQILEYEREKIINKKLGEDNNNED